MQHQQLNRYGLIILILTALLVAACGDEDTTPDSGAATDKGTETTENDASTEDTQEDSDQQDSVQQDREACLASLSGQILENGTDGMTALLAVCVGEELCFPGFITEEDGSFFWEYPISDDEPCITHDYNEQWIHVQIFASDLEIREEYASYSFVRRPTQADISDQGETDYDLDLGTLSLYALSEDSETYVPDSGASVDLSGVAFELPANGIVKRPRNAEEDVPLEFEQPIRVFKAPLDEWDPPFLEETPEALYYIAPRWAKLASPVALSIAPPEGWEEGDTGKLQLLGSWVTGFPVDEGSLTSEFLFRDSEGNCINTDDVENHEQIYDGYLADCGTVEIKDGRLITPPIPRLTWVVITK